MIAALESIPVFAAWTPMSSTTTAICLLTSATGSSRMSVTPVVFWAVIAVIAEVP